MALKLPSRPSGNEPIRASWGREVVDYLRAVTPQSSPDVRLSFTPNGFSVNLTPGGPGGAPAILPFEVYQTADLKVTVNAGRVHWHQQDLDLVATEITVPAGSTNYQIYLALDNELTSGAPVLSATGATSFPTQPNPPARKYLSLALVNSNATIITVLTKKFNGGDIVWPTVFAFWA